MTESHAAAAEPLTLAAKSAAWVGPVPFPDIPNYEITAELGRGGMGVVYLARQRQPYRQVALKMILAGAYSATTDQVRLLLEAEAVAKLIHPNVIAIYEVGRHQGLPFIAMEYCPGGTLAAELLQPMTPRRAAELAETLARAVQAAHAAGVVHRDLKPGNVLRAADGTPKLTDFGLAKHLTGDADRPAPGGLTSTGAVLGSPGYMAPEQATGESKRVGPAADIFALGAILYHMLTGRPPFQAANPVDAIVQTVEADPVPPSRLAGAVPRDLSTICLKCLEKSPPRRYATAADLADDLRRFLDDRPVVAKPATRFDRGRKWLKRHPALALAVAVGVALVVGIPAATLIVSAQLQAERDHAIKAGQDLSKALGETRKAQSQTVEALAFTNLVLAQSFWDQDQVAAAKKHLYAVPPHLRDWEWGFLHRTFGGTSATLYGHTHAVRAVAVSPDGSRVATAGPDGTARVWDAATQNCLRTLVGHGYGVTAVGFSPDGRRVVTAGDDGTARVWDASTGQELFKLQGHVETVASASFSPDGGRVATAGLDNTLRIWDARTGRAVSAFDGPRGAAMWALAYSPDGSRLAVSCTDGTIRVWSTRTGLEVLAVAVRGRTGAIAYSRDGDSLAVGFATGAVKVYDATTGRERLAIAGHKKLVHAVAFGPDGEMATAGDDGLVKIWGGRDGQFRGQLKGHTHAVMAVAFAAAGRMVVTGSDDGTAKIWPLRPESARVAVAGPYRLAVSPDGLRAVTAGADDRETEVRDARTGAAVTRLDREAGAVTAAAYSGDGERLATGRPDGTIDLWHAPSGRWLKELRLSSRPVLALAFGPDADTLASGSADGTAAVWDAASGTVRHVVRESSDPVTAIAMTPNGAGLVTGRRSDSAQLWHLASGRRWLTFHGPNSPVTALAFDPGGRRLVTGRDDGSITLWDMSTGRDRLTLTGHPGAVAAVMFSPDGTVMTSACRGGHVRDWDATVGREQLAIAAHAGAIRGIAFSPPPEESSPGPRRPPRLATRDDNGTTRVWNAETGVAISEATHVPSAWDATVVTSPDGRSVAYGFPDGTLRIVRVEASDDR